jgi:hypothetical protein
MLGKKVRPLYIIFHIVSLHGIRTSDGGEVWIMTRNIEILAKQECAVNNKILYSSDVKLTYYLWENALIYVLP